MRHDTNSSKAKRRINKEMCYHNSLILPTNQSLLSYKTTQSREHRSWMTAMNEEQKFLPLLGTSICTLDNANEGNGNQTLSKNILYWGGRITANWWSSLGLIQFSCIIFRKAIHNYGKERGLRLAFNKINRKEDRERKTYHRREIIPRKGDWAPT